MNTVHSSRESKKTLLTMFFTKEKLFLAFLMNRCTKGAVRLVLDRLEKRMGTYEFASVFEYILTDRGSEFGDPDALDRYNRNAASKRPCLSANYVSDCPPNMAQMYV